MAATTVQRTTRLIKYYKDEVTKHENSNPFTFRFALHSKVPLLPFYDLIISSRDAIVCDKGVKPSARLNPMCSDLIRDDSIQLDEELGIVFFAHKVVLAT